MIGKGEMRARTRKISRIKIGGYEETRHSCGFLLRASNQKLEDLVPSPMLSLFR